jgi:hypothetical protein
MNTITIQINSREALERLIGNDNAVEIDIRNSVVQKFAERHLKPLANCEPITSTLKKIKDSIDAYVVQKVESEIATFKKDYWGNVSEIKLNPSLQVEIDLQIRLKTDTFVFDAVQTAVKKWEDEMKINERIEKRVAYFTEEYIRDEVKKRIEKLKTQI